jgi:hypothetical protein
MIGVVTTRHLLTHSAVIAHEFGTRCLLRCFWRTLTADHAVTFLECAVPIHGNGACLQGDHDKGRPVNHSRNPRPDKCPPSISSRF